MRIKATTSFSGTVSMSAGEERELEAGAILTDLLSCGYVMPVTPSESAEKEIKSEIKRGNKRKD